MYTFLAVRMFELSPPIHFNSSGLSIICTPDPIRDLLKLMHSIACYPSRPNSSLPNQVE
jgi:hypothetical protein